MTSGFSLDIFVKLDHTVDGSWEKLEIDAVVGPIPLAHW